jgi:predicted O-linked N-acetylglucosamine transferase (SPINDLY family)
MSDSRLGILRHRPAPLQVNFGFPGSVGADYLDFIIADRYTLPDADTAFYKEKAVRPAACVMGYYAPPAVDLDTPSRASLGLPEDGFVFCCFNNNYKIQPDTFDVWMRLLRDIEGSVLWLRDTNAVAKANLRQEAERRSVSPDRLVFASHAASYMGYIARFRAADLFLDAFPYNAHTTACEAVWAALPLVTCVGETAVSRVASSILHAANLPELVTCDLASYEAQIRSLVAAPQRLIDIRETLARARSAGALFNPKGFCRNLEAAFEIMHQRQQAGLPPDHIDGPLIS